MESSSDEDIDAMLRRTSDKLGWSAQKNSDDIFKMLLKNVEDSKKKKPVSTRIKRQTPASRRTHKSINWDVKDVSSTKRTLSFENSCLDSPSLSSTIQTNGEVDCTVLSFQKNVTFKRTDENVFEKLGQNVESISKTSQSTTKQNQSVKSDAHLSSCHISGSNINLTPSESENCGQLKNPSEKITSDVTEDKAKGSSADVSGMREANFKTDKGGESLSTPSWYQYREKDESESDDEADGVKPDRIKSDRHTGASSDEDSDAILPTLSLTERLLKTYRSKKATKVKRSQRLNSAECDNADQSKEHDGCIDEDEGKTKHCSGNNSSSDDEDFEKFLLKMKTPVKSEPKVTEESDSDKNFINDESLTDSDDNGPLFYYQQDNEEIPASSLETPNSVFSDQTNKSRDRKGVILVSSADSSDSDAAFASPVRPKGINKRKDKENIPSSLKTPVNRFLEGKKETFLQSLDTPPVGTPVSSPFVKNFKKKRSELTAKLFTMFNKTVFENKLPHNLEVLWNKRMRKTAGYCVYTKGKFSGIREVRIELSEKVCDSAERLRDTLIHEMCHAACWLIHGVNDGHGRFWKYWACKANLAHPEIPLVKRCHSYEIHTKFKYQCQQCQAIVGRHSKSLDVSKKCCGICRGRFVLLPQENGKEGKKQQPNKFAMYVKENYASVKKTSDYFKHADVMRILSQEFARKASVAD